MGTLQTNSSFQRLAEAIGRISGAFHVTLDSGRAENLSTYFSTLCEWNKSINLSGIRDEEQLVYKHLGDSLIFEKFLGQGAIEILDIGSGPGVPGLLLKILRPELQVVLSEAVKKKCSFLRYVSSLLNLSGLQIEEGRLMPGTRPKDMPPAGFDVVVSQAAGSLGWLLDLSIPVISMDGMIASLKGPCARQETALIAGRARRAGLRIHVKDLVLPVLEHQRVMVLFQKGRC